MKERVHMEVIKETNLLDNDVKKIIEQLEKEILEKITNLEKDEENLKTSDIQNIKNGTSKEVGVYFNLFLEKILNYYLDKLKELDIKKYFEVTKRTYINDEWKKVPEKYLKAERLIDDIMEYCDPCGKYDTVFEDSEYIAYSLMRKKLNVNGWVMPEPVKIEYIEIYSVSSSKKPEEFEILFWYMILYIATHYYVLKSIS